MTNIRERVGDMTPEQSGALGFVPDGLGRLVFEVCWTPSAPLLRSRLHEAVVELVLPELARQTRVLVEAHLDLQLAQAALAWSRSPTQAQRMSAERARGRLAAVRAMTWPRTTLESLPALVGAVVAEIAGRNHCPECAGRKEHLVGELVVPCAGCKGQGVLPMSDRSRALAIKRDPAEYRRKWRLAYEWLLDQLREAEAVAARETWTAMTG